MDHSDGFAIYNKAFDRKVEEKLFMRWVFGYQHAMGFDEFKARCKPVEQKSAEEVYDKVKGIMEKFKWQ